MAGEADPSAQAKHIVDRLLKDRIVMLVGPIDQVRSAEIVSQLKNLRSSARDTAARLYIMSPGGSIKPALVVFESVKELAIDTYVIGNVVSSACLIAAAGRRGHRYILPSAKIRLGACWGGESETREKFDCKIAELLGRECGHSAEEALRDMRSDREFDARSAVAYGLVDAVLS